MSSKIEWTEVTVNTITGCTKYSEGCKNCYAEKLHKRLAAMGQEKYKLPFEIIKCHNPITELSKKITKNVKMCFVNSMSDTFHKEVSDITLFVNIQDHEEYADSEIYLNEIAGEVLESMTNILTERQLSLQCKRNALIQKAQRG